MANDERVGERRAERDDFAFVPKSETLPASAYSVLGNTKGASVAVADVVLLLQGLALSLAPVGTC